MIKEQLTAYELILDMIKGKTGHLSRVTYTPQKPPFAMHEPVEQPFCRCTPEEQGISSRYLAAFLQEAAAAKETDIHGFMVLRNGYVIGEYSFAPYQKGIWHIEHSMCKSITGMAIGLLISEGKLALDDKIVKIFSKSSLLGNMRQKNITVEHLLTMTSGVVFNELGIVSGDDWVKFFLDSSVSGTPGERFEYNSMNSYMLSAIVTELTGETLVEYLTPRLFEPLGIRKFFWESCPQGITKGGWGLFLCQEDAAKLGQLYLDGGRWKGQQIIPKEWVERSVAKQMDTPPEMGQYGYGYQIWRGGRKDSFNFNGMLGQNVVVYPDLQMVLVLNAASNELFQNCVLMNLVRKYFERQKIGVTEEHEPVYEEYMPADVLPPDPVGWRHLAEVERRLASGGTRRPELLHGGWKRQGKQERGRRIRRTAERQMDFLDGKDFILGVRQAGIFPLIMQVFHNNFTDGIRQIGFRREGQKNWLLLWEGDELLKIEIGFQRAAVSEILVHGESYLIAVRGEFARNEEGKLVLKLDIAFLEEAARRMIKCVFTREDRVTVYFDERPGKDLIMEGLEGIMKAASEKILLKNLMEFGGISLPELLVENTIQPRIEGWLKENELTQEERVTGATPDPF
jgi:CubicO group peptidase (beta-lactamase class C family)